MGPLDPGWHGEKIVDGLSSGEGLIAAVRDPVHRKEPIKDKGKVVDYQDVMIDEGVADKRLMIQATEFGGVLKVLSREGNTLSAILRQSRDNGRLAVMTKPAFPADQLHEIPML